MAKQLPAVGSWVRIHQPGFWQVYRVLADVREPDPMDGKIRRRHIVFVRHFVTDNFRPASAQTCCDPSLAKPLSKRDAQKLDAFIQQNPALWGKFAAAVPPPIDAVYNVRHAAPKGATAPKLTKWLSSLGELTTPEISQALSESKNAADSPEWLLQFVSPDHQTNSDGYLLYRLSQVSKV